MNKPVFDASSEKTMFDSMIAELETMKKSVMFMLSSLKTSQKHFTKKKQVAEYQERVCEARSFDQGA